MAARRFARAAIEERLLEIYSEIGAGKVLSSE
jgi:hypothetical protein